jgi:hypothetical protein
MNRPTAAIGGARTIKSGGGGGRKNIGGGGGAMKPKPGSLNINTGRST